MAHDVMDDGFVLGANGRLVLLACAKYINERWTYQEPVQTLVP